MEKFKTTFIFTTICLILSGCFNSSWTDKQRKELEIKCSQTDTFKNKVFLFKGFDNNEFDSILVRDYIDAILVDSFKVFVWPAQSPSDKERKDRSATIERTMNIKHKYSFVIPEQKPYELANMKMIMWAQYTMSGEGWGCEMGDFTIDEERFENTGNPTFIKREKNEPN